MWCDPKGPENAQGAGDWKAVTSHTLFCEILKRSFKMLLIMKKYYPKLPVWVGTLHVKLSTLIPLTKVNVPEGRGPS